MEPLVCKQCRFNGTESQDLHEDDEEMNQFDFTCVVLNPRALVNLKVGHGGQEQNETLEENSVACFLNWIRSDACDERLGNDDLRYKERERRKIEIPHRLSEEIRREQRIFEHVHNAHPGDVQ